MNDDKIYKVGQEWLSDILTNEVTKICNKCGMILPIENFRIVKGQFRNPYFLGHCKKCEYKYQRNYLKEKNKTTIIPIGTDEVFVRQRHRI